MSCGMDEQFLLIEGAEAQRPVWWGGCEYSTVCAYSSIRALDFNDQGNTKSLFYSPAHSVFPSFYLHPTMQHSMAQQIFS